MMAENNESIVVTGIGMVLPTGCGLKSLWSAFVSGQPAFSVYRDERIKTQLIPFFGHVPAALLAEARQNTPHKLRRFAPDYTACAVLAARDALADASSSWTEVPEERRGLYTCQSDSTTVDVFSFARALEVSYRADGIDFQKFTQEALHRRGADPFLAIKSLSNNVLALLSLIYRFRGDCGAFVQDESAALSALQRACFSLRHGYSDIALVVGAGTYNEALVLTEHYKLGHLSPCSQGPHSLRSFDSERDGTLLGEGAVALVLERVGSAKLRGAAPRVEFGGMVSTTFDRSAPVRSPLMAEEVLSLLAEAGIRPENLGLVCADGKGTVRHDADEIALLEAVFAGASVPVTSLRPIVGALNAAGPLADIAAASAMFQKEAIPPIATLRNPTSERIDFVREGVRPLACATGLTLHTSFNGFFGAILLKHPGVSTR